MIDPNIFKAKLAYQMMFNPWLRDEHLPQAIGANHRAEFMPYRETGEYCEGNPKGNKPRHQDTTCRYCHKNTSQVCSTCTQVMPGTTKKLWFGVCTSGERGCWMKRT